MNDAAPADTAVESSREPAMPGFITGLLLGGLVGVTVAMIVAPQAGDDTRDALLEKAQMAAESVRDAADDLSKTAQASTNDLLARGKQIVEEARARFEVAVADGKDAAAQQRGILKNET